MEASAGAIAWVRTVSEELGAQFVPTREAVPVRRGQMLLAVVEKRVRQHDGELLFVGTVEQAQTPRHRIARVEHTVELGPRAPSVPGEVRVHGLARWAPVLADADVEMRRTQIDGHVAVEHADPRRSRGGDLEHRALDQHPELHLRPVPLEHRTENREQRRLVGREREHLDPTHARFVTHQERLRDQRRHVGRVHGVAVRR